MVGGTMLLGVALVVGVVALLAWIGSFDPVRNTVRRTFLCPLAGERVAVEFLEEVWDGRPAESTRAATFHPRRVLGRCSALERRPGLACGAACLRPEAFGSAIR